MASADILESLKRWERELPVSEWTVNGIRVWPLVRLGLGTSLWRAQNTQPVPAEAARQSKRFARTKTVLDLRKAVQATWQDRAHATLGRARTDVVFLAGSSTRNKLLGRYYHTLCDPLGDLLEREGKSSLMIEYAGAVAAYRLPRYRESLLLQPQQVLADFSGFFGRLSGKSLGPIALPGYENLVQDARELGQTNAVPDLENLKWQTARISWVAAYFTRVLRRTQPKLVANVCYYNAYGMALNLAARRLGILSVDLQHGAFIHNPAYDSWTALPQDGYELLPDLFWCWSERDAAVIDAWPNPERRTHRALVGGQPWTCALQDPKNPFVAQLTASVDALQRRTPELSIVLLTLQWDAGFTPLMKAMIQAAPSTLHFWIRLHPLMITERAEIKRWVAEHCPGRCSVDEPTDLPLPLLLRRTHVHCTRFSTVVQEAAAAGVPSVVLDPSALEHYGPEAKAGWVVAADSAQSAVAAFTKLAAQARDGDGGRGLHGATASRAQSSLGTPATMQATLHELFVRARQRKQQLTHTAKHARS